MKLVARGMLWLLDDVALNPAPVVGIADQQADEIRYAFRPR